MLLEADPQVQKSVDSIPQVRALHQNARKIVAQRTGTPFGRRALDYHFYSFIFF